MSSFTVRSFIPAMLWRELRSTSRRLLVFLFCIAAGVGGLVAVKSFAYNLERAVQLEARSLMAADIVLRSRRPLSEAEEAAVSRLQEQGATVVRSTQFLSMARAEDDRDVQLVSVRVVGDGYPFYGEVLTGSGRPFRELLRDDTVLVHNALLLKMGLEVGAVLRLGERAYRIADTLVREPDSPVQAFDMGPRVLMTEAGGQATGLIRPTSQVRYAALIKLPQGQDPFLLAEALRTQLPERFATIDTYDRAQPQVTRFLSRLTDFLSLVGLAALLLGGIGVAGAIRVLIAQKLDTLAILKCLGATSGRLLTVYLLLALTTALVGSALGVALGYGAQAVLPWLLADLLPVDLELTWPWRAAAEGALLGTLTTLWFALPPLLALRKVPPARIFRRTVEGAEDGGLDTGSLDAGHKGPAPSRWAALRALWRRRRGALANGASLIALVTVLSLWQAGTPTIALIFVAGLTGAVAALQLSALGLLALLRRLPKPARFVLRQGLSSLYRPGNQSAPVVMSLGLGVLLLLAIFLTQQDLLRQVDAGSTADQPNIFFLDIQPDQRQAFSAALAEHGHAAPELLPIVRGRVVALNGESLQQDEVKDDHTRRHLTYEYSLTWRGALVDGERVVAGHFGLQPEVAGPQVSLADWFAEDSGLEVGDTVTVDIQGVRVTATVTSIRKIDWANRRANFSLVYLPGALEQAPAMYVSAIHEPDEVRRAAIQRAVVGRLPNVTALDVSMVFRIVQGFMDRIALVVQFMAGFCIAVGLVILISAIVTTKYQRIREAVLLKTLGATRGAVARVLSVEYLVLGLLAGAVGVLAAGALSWGLVTFVFDGRWDLRVQPYLLAWVGAAAVIAVTGLLGSLDILLKKPLEVLREE